MNKMLKELEVGLKHIEELKEDYKAKNNDNYGDYNAGAIQSLENSENEIKRAIARACLSDKVNILQEWIGVLCESYKNDNTVTYDAIAEQVVYEMFKDELIDKF